MNAEQTTPENASNPTDDSSKGLENNQDKPADNYYSVDDPKKEFNTSIGDGEMHNEGLVGDGTVAEGETFSEGSTTGQDAAENHDSEG